MKKVLGERNGLIERVANVLARRDGTEVAIISLGYWMHGLPGEKPKVETHVLTRQQGEQDWQYCSTQPAPGWREMSVDEYVRRGRPPFLVKSSFAERALTSRLVGMPVVEARAKGLVS